MNKESDYRIEEMSVTEWPAVRAIYVEGIATGLATFETEAPDWQAWDENHLPVPRLVTRSGDRIAGWAALSPVSDRCVYGGVAEVSVYVAEAYRGRGLGKALLKELIERSEDAGIWTLQAGIFPENKASIGVHLASGFRVVGIRERLGQLNGQWRDVALLERRSEAI
ncbi:MAG: N-acetyltransferase [Chloroflexota bacterium]|nr:MAG: N-acetyltransferase [Chloroflexota bacterium]